jgi:hypothetical protein
VKVVKSIGLKSQILFKIGICEHLSCIGEKLESVNNDKDIPSNLKPMVAEREAILQAVAKMIDENNKIIFQQLKNQEIIEDSVNP